MYVNDIAVRAHFIIVVYCRTGIASPCRKAEENILWACAVRLPKSLTDVFFDSFRASAPVNRAEVSFVNVSG